MSPWPGIALVLGLIGVTLALLHLYQQRCEPPAERVRKLFHMIGAALGVGLPWLFDRVWPVAFLGSAVLLGLMAVRCSRRLRAGVGRVIHDVGRRSVGDLCFPLAVCLVFVVTGGDRLRVAIGLLPLMLADPAAALVGRRWGRHRYRIPGGVKSLEGSVAFFAIAFLCVAGALVGAGELPSLATVAAFALFLTVVEALAARGLDNLLVPLSAVLAVDFGFIGGTIFPTAPLE
ncbi:MAG: diacylglycerol/polyprenol kinase family protein [Candidatus Rokuibacteriota bacterium]